jgi:hypothetical protein
MFPFELKPLEVKIVAHVGKVLVIDINIDRKLQGYYMCVATLC